MARSPTLYLALLLVAVAVISVQAGAYYYFRTLYPGNEADSVSGASPSVPCNGQLPETNVTSVDVFTLINYGNETSKWYNETGIPAAWNFYHLTVFLARCNLEAQYYGAPLNEHYVTGINGVRNDPPSFWILWVYCQKDGAWSVSKVGVDLIKLVDNSVLAWYYQRLQSGSSYTQQPPVVGAKTVALCS